MINNNDLDHTAIYKILHKNEVENVLMQHYGYLPKTTQVRYYTECLESFMKIPIIEAYNQAIKQLKQRNGIQIDKFKEIPYELKSLVYFSRRLKTELEQVNTFLDSEYGG